jgi:arginine repressor
VLCYYDKNKHGNINSVFINKLNLYANNRISFNDIKSILRDKKIQYLFVTNKNVARDLLTRQFEAVKLSNNKEKTYYLFKTPESLLKKEGK